MKTVFIKTIGSTFRPESDTIYDFNNKIIDLRALTVAFGCWGSKNVRFQNGVLAGSSKTNIFEMKSGADNITLENIRIPYASHGLLIMNATNIHTKNVTITRVADYGIFSDGKSVGQTHENLVVQEGSEKETAIRFMGETDDVVMTGGSICGMLCPKKRAAFRNHSRSKKFILNMVKFLGLCANGPMEGEDGGSGYGISRWRLANGTYLKPKWPDIAITPAEFAARYTKETGSQAQYKLDLAATMAERKSWLADRQSGTEYNGCEITGGIEYYAGAQITLNDTVVHGKVMDTNSAGCPINRYTSQYPKKDMLLPGDIPRPNVIVHHNRCKFYGPKTMTYSDTDFGPFFSLGSTFNDKPIPDKAA